jgi:hypothetical protein
MASFIPGIVPAIDTRSNHAMSPQINHFTEGDKVERGTRATIRTQTNSKSNTNSRDKDAPTGRKPNYDRRQVTNMRFGKQVKFDARISLKGKSTPLTSSDFGFEILGSSTPTIYTGSKDQTLFRDYNQGGTLPVVSTLKSVNTVSNSIKLLDINFAESIDISRGYKEAWFTIAGMIRKDVVINTKSSKGAIDRIDTANLLSYHDIVSRGFDMLIQLEVLQAWNPASNDYFDSCLRQLSAKACTPELLRARTSLRQVLIPHVLPDKMLEYTRWLRETKLRNTSPESTKERFVDKNFLDLYYYLTVGVPPAPFLAKVTALIAEIYALDEILPAILINNVECTSYRNVKEAYNNVHNSAVYDPEFNNIWTNRSVVSTVGGLNPDFTVFPRYEDGNGIASFETTNPTVLALATLGQQQVPSTSGLPLEGYMQAYNCENSTAHQCNRHFFYINGPTGDVVLKGIDEWFEVVDDSMHVTNGSGSAMTGISKPAGVNTAAYILGDSNIQMACRVALSEIFGVYHG